MNMEKASGWTAPCTRQHSSVGYNDYNKATLRGRIKQYREDRKMADAISPDQSQIVTFRKATITAPVQDHAARQAATVLNRHAQTGRRASCADIGLHPDTAPAPAARDAQVPAGFAIAGSDVP